MSLLKKLKLLFKIRKPTNQLIEQITNAKDDNRGWKTAGFWITTIGILVSTVSALTGIIPASTQIIIVTVLQAIYNILRGAQNAEMTSQKGIFKTTEFWTTVFAELQKALVVYQTAGVTPEMMSAATSVVAVSLAAGQNLSTRIPDNSKE
jgi:hypothetical protein